MTSTVSRHMNMCPYVSHVDASHHDTLAAIDSSPTRMCDVQRVCSRPDRAIAIIMALCAAVTALVQTDRTTSDALMHRVPACVTNVHELSA